MVRMTRSGCNPVSFEPAKLVQVSHSEFIKQATSYAQPHIQE